jgi:Protein of unknown function (DUF3775)
MRNAPNLSISPEKVFFIVTKSRQSDSNAIGPDASFDSSDDVAEDHSKSTDRSELSRFIRDLNVDEQIDLVALMWLGRGDGDLDNWRDLRSEAEGAQNNRTGSGRRCWRTIWRRRCRSSASHLRISKSIFDFLNALTPEPISVAQEMRT